MVGRKQMGCGTYAFSGSVKRRSKQTGHSPCLSLFRMGMTKKSSLGRAPTREPMALAKAGLFCLSLLPSIVCC